MAKRATKKSAMERSLARLKAEGALAQKVEHWNQYARRRIDLFGVIDVVALLPSRSWTSFDSMEQTPPILALQICLQNDFHKNKRKVEVAPGAARWVECGGRFEVWAWAPHKVKRGGTAVRWRRNTYRLMERQDDLGWELVLVDCEATAETEPELAF